MATVEAPAAVNLAAVSKSQKTLLVWNFYLATWRVELLQAV